MFKVALVGVLLCWHVVSFSSVNSDLRLENKLNTIIKSHYQKYKDKEYFSGIGVAVSLPNKAISNYSIGTIAHEQTSAKMTADSLFDVGSITKSFTAVLVLKAMGQKKLSLSDPLDKTISDYPRWGKLNITQLLNMTSGLPNYTDTPTWNYLESQNLARQWSNSELIQFVYPNAKHNPPLKAGYFYSNTGYILAAMILEKIHSTSFAEQLKKQIFNPLKLQHTYYLNPEKNSEAYHWLVHGYGYNQYDNPILVGKDLHLNHLSWAGAAGGIVASPTDVALWVRDLFESPTLLTQSQRDQMMQLVACDNGKRIASTSEKHSEGFALGVAQKYTKKIGRFWYYEGSTLGFRVLYIYIPYSKIIIVVAFNSAVNVENDHAHELATKLYQAIIHS